MPLLVALRTIHIAVSVLIAGSMAFEWLVLPGALAAPDTADIGPALRKWVRRLCLVAAGLGVLTWVGWLAVLAVRMSGLPPAQALRWAVLEVVVTRTTFGHVWVLRGALWLTTAGLLMRPAPRRDRAAAALLGGCSLVLAGSLAWTGHAVGASPLHLALDVLHLCAASLWLGMLPALGCLMRQAWRSGEGPALHAAARAALRFSSPAASAVLLLAVTGLVNSSWLLDSPADLLATAYGRLLTVKLLLFAAMLSLAAINRFVLVPRIAAPDIHANHRSTAGWLYRTVLAEALLGTVLLAVVGLLGVTPPAHDKHAGHEMHDMHH
jgi:copper resistance protein D